MGKGQVQLLLDTKFTSNLSWPQGARNKSNTHFPAVFPPDDTNATLPLVAYEDVWWTEFNIGNELLSERIAQKVVLQYTEALQAKHPG